MNTDELRERTKLTRSGFSQLLEWLESESLVTVAYDGSSEPVGTTVLTERGEAVLIRLLELTCELPESR